jgi:hypothetical protein
VIVPKHGVYGKQRRELQSSTDAPGVESRNHRGMVRHRVLAHLPVVGVLAVLALAPPTRADTLIQPLSGARNLTEWDGWLAWAQPTAGGRWRLAVRSPQGVTTTPTIPDFGAPPDPSLGWDDFYPSVRRLFVVYSRCAGSSAIAGCDVYRYDVADGTEAKVMAISTPTASETAPSLRYGFWSFVRRGSGVRAPGVYEYRPAPAAGVHVPSAYAFKHGGALRLSSVLARETVMSAGHLAYSYNSSHGGGVAARQLNGTGGAIHLITGQPTVPASLVSTRYRFGWLTPTTGGVSFMWTSRVSGKQTYPDGRPIGPPTLRRANRTLPASTNSITTDDHLPDHYLDQTGISTLLPPLF